MNRILVGLDGSGRAESVLTAAIDLARKYNAKLILCRSVGVPAEMPAEIWKDPVPLSDHLRQDAEKYLLTNVPKVPAELFGGHRTLVEVGTPWAGICQAAKEENADLIVIGSHGYSGLDKILGTTAAKVVNHAHCSVWVVR